MATYYVDGAAGSDANAGTSFASAFASIGKAASSVAAGDTVLLCATGTYVLTSTVTWNVPGDAVSGRITVQGANASGVVDGTKAAVTSATSSVALFTLNNADYHTFRYITFTHTGSTRGNGITVVTSSADKVMIRDCVFDGCLAAVTGGTSSITTTLELCEVMNCTTTVGAVSGGMNLIGCYIHDNAGDGYRGSFNPMVAIDCVIVNNGGIGLNDITSSTQTNPFMVVSCTIANNGSDGIKSATTTAGSGQSAIVDNVLYGNGGYGINWSSATAVQVSTFPTVCRNNAFGANTSGARNTWPAGIGDFTLSVDPFTNDTGSNRDYSLNATTGGGAACRAAGFPGAFQGSATFTNYKDVGAVQHQSAVGGTSGPPPGFMLTVSPRRRPRAHGVN